MKKIAATSLLLTVGIIGCADDGFEATESLEQVTQSAECKPAPYVSVGAALVPVASASLFEAAFPGVLDDAQAGESEDGEQAEAEGNAQEDGPGDFLDKCWASCVSECQHHGGCKYVNVENHGLSCSSVCNDDESGGGWGGLGDPATTCGSSG